MPSTKLSAEAAEVVRDSAQEVLETMFFAMVEDEEDKCPQKAGADDIGAYVGFDGTWQGWTEVRLSRCSSDAISRDFLGLDSDEDVDDQQRTLVVGELANMVCGRALSRLEPNGTFHLGAPTPVPALAQDVPEGAVHVELPLETGRIDVRLVTT